MTLTPPCQNDDLFNLFMTSKKQNHEFTNSKCCKMYFKAFKMKKQGLKCFIK